MCKFSIADLIIHFFSQYFYYIYCKVLLNFMVHEVIIICWIVIYPVDGAIQRLNNPGANQIVGCVANLTSKLKQP